MVMDCYAIKSYMMNLTVISGLDGYKSVVDAWLKKRPLKAVFYS